MEAVIERFLALRSGYGSGDGYGAGDGAGAGSGDGYGYGYGDGAGAGAGAGSGDGYGYGDGAGAGAGAGIHSIGQATVYAVDGVQTIIKKVRGMVAEGFILRADLTMQPCFIARSGDVFAHGNTLKQAVAEAEAKALENEPEEDRIARFLEKFPNGGLGQDLFDAHGWLTGSCLTGRTVYVEDRGIDLTKTYTLAEFVALCKDAYGGETVRKLTTR